MLPILTPGKDWAKSLLSRMGYVKRKATTKGKVSVDDFEKIKESFLKDIYVTVNMEDIPDQLIINWDHTALQYVPVSHWTIMEKKGSTRVPVAGVDDKRQLTIILACSMTGDFLPIQAIYKGKTPKCLPPYHFPSDWDVTYTVNHWANEETLKQYLVSSIIIPYIQKKKKELGLPPSQPALVLFDHFKCQTTEECLKLLEENYIQSVIIPENCIDRLQPLDVSVNKPVKDFIKAKFQKWYGQQVAQQLREGGIMHAVDTRLSIMKPLSAEWLVSMYDHFRQQEDIIRHGFSHCGITECLNAST